MRFGATAGPNSNGVNGNGNFQTYEILPPGEIGSNRKYKLQVATDGVNFIDAHEPYLTVNTDMVKNIPGYTVYTDKHIRDVYVRYIDLETNEELLDTKKYKAYDSFKTDYFGIGPETIDGYQLVESPILGSTVAEQKEIIYRYKKVGNYNIVNSRSDLSKLIEEVKKVREEEVYIYALKPKKDALDKSIEDAELILGRKDSRTLSSP